MRRAIITGATGALGMALIKKLIEENIDILILSRKGSKRTSGIPSHSLVTVVECSLDEFESKLNDSRKSYDVFYHFAWDGTTGQARHDMFLQNQNVKFTLDAVKLAYSYGCHTFIGAGSQAEYGRVEDKLRPDTPVFPETGYGIAKLCAGQMSRVLAHQLGMRHVWARILSVYGPYDSENSLVMYAINKLLAGEVPELTKGEQMWDYLYSVDAAEILYRLADRGVDGKTYVVGSGQARPLADYIKDIRDVVRPGAEVGLGLRQYPDKQVMYLCADINDLQKDIGWKAEMQFKDGILKIITGEKP